jgi:hypothetical protein
MFASCALFATLQGCEGQHLTFTVTEGRTPNDIWTAYFLIPGRCWKFEFLSTEKKGLVRSVELFEVRALWSSLEYEVAESPCLLDVFEVPAKDRQPSIVDLPAYTSHPLVKEHVKQGLAMPIPVSVYLDSVAFITQAAGRSESVLGIWVINELSQKRHLLATLKGGDQCRCGCRGDCSIFPLLENLRWQLASLQRGHLEVVKR